MCCLGTAASRGRPLHLLGLVSDGGVHSHVNHLLGLIELCRRHGVRPLLHLITDGRDTSPRSALSTLDQVEQALEGPVRCTACFITRMEVLYRVWKDEGERAGRLPYEQI